MTTTGRMPALHQQAMPSLNFRLSENALPIGKYSPKKHQPEENVHPQILKTWLY